MISLKSTLATAAAITAVLFLNSETLYSQSLWTPLSNDIYYNSGNVAIGKNTAPVATLDIEATPFFGQETILRASVADATNVDYFSLKNVTGGNGRLVMAFNAHRGSFRDQTMFFQASISPAVDDSMNPLISFIAKRLDANNNSSNVTHRPLFEWRNYRTIHMIMNKDGDVKIGDIGTYGVPILLANFPTEKLDVGGNLRVRGTADALAYTVNGVPFQSSQWNTNGNNISYTNGKVGIGTTNPFKQLHIKTSHFNVLEPPLPSCVTNPEIACDPGVGGGVGTHRGIRLEDFTLFNTGAQATNVWDIVPNELGLLSFGVPLNPPALILVTNPTSGVSGVTATGSFHTGSDIHLFGNTGKIESKTLDVSEIIKVGTSSLLLGLLDGVDENNIWTTSNHLILQNDASGNPNGRVGIKTDVPKATLHVNGNVIIGTAGVEDPPHTDFDLAVRGKLVAWEMHTTITGWGDFVFEEEYKRMALEKKEEYVFENKHLPGMQSAEIIESRGLNVGESLRGVTINVEENTLDLIEINRIVKLQREEIEELQKTLLDQQEIINAMLNTSSE